jgi:isoamylase
VTTLELLPVQAFLQDWFLLKRGLGNYWGYNTMAFFAPQPEYLVDGDPDEVRLAVKRLHEAGIEVILDVVYNHTAETDELGPTISMRGIDNASYYRLVGVAPGARDGMRAGAAARPAGDGDHGHDGNRGADDGAHAGRYYVNDTGCGNTLNISHPRVLQLVLDSLRYWAESFHIDGFRFDLGTTLGREAHGFDAGAGFFDAIMQDPVLSRLKLVSEPWDLGPDGYQLGRHPPGWAEWNDRYRDSVRRFWRGDAGMRADLAGRLAGSAELFDHRHRKPWASVNYVACHDGATLDDVLRYRGKHNEANGEGNRDGASENYNANLSAEEAAAGAHVHADTGISADTSADTDSETGSSAGANADAIVDARVERLRRAMLATVMLSQGTPMLLGGDEFGRTQRGNNNAYCQDNAISWIDWRLAATPAGRTTTAFVGRLAALRRDFPVLQASRFLHGERLVAPGLADIAWFDERGAALDAAAWQDDQAKVFALRLAGPASSGGAQCVLLCFNAWREPIEFTLPASNPPWRLLLDSAAPDAPAPGDATARTTSSIEVKGHSIMVFATRPANQEHVA